MGRSKNGRNVFLEFYRGLKFQDYGGGRGDKVAFLGLIYKDTNATEGNFFLMSIAFQRPHLLIPNLGN